MSEVHSFDQTRVYHEEFSIKIDGQFLYEGKPAVGQQLEPVKFMTFPTYGDALETGVSFARPGQVVEVVKRYVVTA